MPLPATSTHVSYPASTTEGTGTVLAALQYPATVDGRWLIITDHTPFHPLDSTWPDQPADTGELIVADHHLRVVDCLTGAASEGDDRLYVAGEIPAKRGDLEWRWLVLHVVATDTDPTRMIGQPAELRVDAARRRRLSAGHTGCHLMALALNEALAARWRKPVRTDGLGRPDFDALAILSSRIRPNGSTDTYRIGKSLRKKGFTSDGLAEQLPAIQRQIDDRLATWIASDATVRLEVPGPEVTTPRTWSCALAEGTPTIPCGGTHLDRLGHLARLTVDLTLDDEAVLVVDTAATLREI
ncbi:MAG: metal-dependent hydrolase [Pseudonocardiales bacterium]